MCRQDRGASSDAGRTAAPGYPKAQSGWTHAQPKRSPGVRRASDRRESSSLNGPRSLRLGGQRQTGPMATKWSQNGYKIAWVSPRCSAHLYSKIGSGLELTEIPNSGAFQFTRGGNPVDALRTFLLAHAPETLEIVARNPAARSEPG